jgi:subfamily B ATP-binding cassette protein MsbA
MFRASRPAREHGWRSDRVPSSHPSRRMPGRRLPSWGRLIRLTEARHELSIFRRLFALARQELWFLPAMAALALLSALFEGLSLALVIPLVQTWGDSAAPADRGWLLTMLHDTVAAIPIESRLLAVLGAIFAAIILKSVVSYANMVVLGVVYGRLSHALRTAVFAKIVGRPLVEIERERSGRLLDVLNTETWRATDALNSLFTMITSLSTLAVFVALLLLLSWHLTLLALLCVALLPPLIRLITGRVKELSQQGLEASEALAKRTWTALNSLRIIHAFGREGFEVSRFNENSDRVRHIFLRMALISVTTGPIMEVLVTGVVLLLALLTDAAHVPIGTLVGFLAILYRLQPRLLSLVAAHANLLSQHAPVSAVCDLIATSTEASTSRGTVPFAGLRDGVVFDDVTFAHHGAGHPTLAHVTMRIPRGSMVAIVGVSGAGKSTMLDLLLRFHEPESGTIWVDGVPLRDIEVSSWRSRLAVVSQDPYIFDDTVRSNLLYGRPDCTDAEMVGAARLACADEFIRQLPLGYETVVGERGTQISGGQRQRLALARALVRDPDILILDEATNALDTLTDRAFQEALVRFGRDRTIIVVAHRQALIENADHVVVLDGGRVVEQGSPRSLLQAGGLYTRMFGLGDANRVSHQLQGSSVDVPAPV